MFGLRALLLCSFLLFLHHATPLSFFPRLCVCCYLVSSHLSAWTWLWRNTECKWDMGWNNMKQTEYKSPHTISPALMKGGNRAASRAQILCSSFILLQQNRYLKILCGWLFFPLPPLSVWEAQNGCLEYSGVACEGTSFAILHWDIFWHILGMIVEFITFIASCYAVVELCNWNTRGLLNLDLIDSK